MSLPRLVLCLTLLVSSLGFAQTPEDWTPYTPPSPETTSPPPLVPAPTPSEVRPPSQAPTRTPPDGGFLPHTPRPMNSEGTQTALRLVVTPWAGAMAGMMGLIIGTVPTAILALPFCLGSQSFEQPQCVIAVSTGLSLSYSVGVTLGVAFTGKMMGGRGDGVVTFLGALAGAAAGAGLGVATESTAALILGLSLGPLLGAVTGYEFSHSMADPPGGPKLQARSRVQVVPVLGATPQGGILGGLAGRF